MNIFKEAEGIISKKPIWICIDKNYLYTGDTFIKLIISIILEWKDDKNLVG